jgi:thioredoxin reductase/ferredoxin
MDFLIHYQALKYLIGAFLLLVIVIPFALKEIRIHRNAKLLANRIVPVSSLTEAQISLIKSRHPSGRKMYPMINKSVCVGCGTCVLSCRKAETLTLIGGKSTLVNPLGCDGCGECENACPTGANQLTEFGIKIKVRLPDIDENYESNIKGIYIIGTLAGAGLIKETINQGRAVLNHIMRGVFPENLPQVLIVGAGPAGLSAFLSCKKFGLPATCLEKEETANTIKNFPKKKIVMAEPVDMPLFGPLWIGDTDREKLLEVWDRILEKTGAKITLRAKLETIERKGNQFVVSASGRTYLCDKIVLALGVRGEPRKLKVPGENASKVFYALLDAQEFAKSAVTIVGGGDAAIEAALALMNQGCRVTLIVRDDGFPRAKARNQGKIAGAIKNGSVDVRFKSTVLEIKARLLIISTSDKTQEIENDFVFVMIGGELPYPLLEKIGIRIIEKSL